MAIKVEFGFSASGEPTEFKDITADVLGLSVDRGKDPQQDTFNAASCGIQLNNETRNYDPDYPDSPYQGLILPTGSVRIYAEDQIVFTGIITDWNFSYSPNGESIAEIVASDSFWNLSNQVLTEYEPVEQLSSARILSVLARPELGGTAVWPSTARVISSGVATMGDYSVTNGNALSYLQEVEKAEPGRLFIDKQGRIVFRSRYNDLDNPSYEYTRVNLSANPSFETNIRSWTAGTGTITRSTAQSYIGTASGSLSAGGNVSQYFTSNPFSDYTASIYAKASSGTATLLLSGLTSTTGTAYTTLDSVTAEITDSEWTRVSTSFNTLSRFSGIKVAQTPSASAVFLDALLIEETPVVDAYFDGDNDPVYNTTDPEEPDYQPERAFETYETDWIIE
jgi:hypothetical protein